jgi:hypothetical protein
MASWKFWKTEDRASDPPAPVTAAASVAVATPPATEAEKFARLLDVLAQPVPTPAPVTPQALQKCGNCFCFDDGMCYRHPPTLIIIPHTNIDVRWPAVKASQWCGEWRARA